MRPANPYADLRALLDTTRRLSPEETAELLLEQGFLERALAIYERLHEAQPHVFFYRQRRDWLRRLVRLEARSRAGGGVGATLRGIPSPAACAPTSDEASEVRRLAIVGVE